MPATSLKILEDEISFQPIWAPGSSRDITPRVLRNEFGDGYRQNIKDGINNTRRRWRLNNDALSPVEFKELDEFLKWHEGYIAFLFQPPAYEGEDPDTGALENVAVLAISWSTQFLSGGYVDVQLEIEEEFI